MANRLDLGLLLAFSVDEEVGDLRFAELLQSFVPLSGTGWFVKGFGIPLNPRFPDISLGE